MGCDTPDELREWAKRASNSNRADVSFAPPFAAADAWDIEIARSEGLAALARDYASQIADLHERLEAAEIYRISAEQWCEVAMALQRQLEKAEKAWADFKEHYPWTIQPHDDMQMTPEAVAALERLAAILAGEDR